MEPSKRKQIPGNPFEHHELMESDTNYRARWLIENTRRRVETAVQQVHAFRKKYEEELNETLYSQATTPGANLDSFFFPINLRVTNITSDDAKLIIMKTHRLYLTPGDDPDDPIQHLDEWPIFGYPLTVWGYVPPIDSEDFIAAAVALPHVNGIRVI